MLSNLAAAFADSGDPGRAVNLYEQALNIAHEIGDLRNEGNAFYNKGVALDKLGEREQAVAHAEKALKIFEDIKDPLAGQHVIIPSHAILVAHGKGGSTRLVPLNRVAYDILIVLCNDRATGDYLFSNRDGTPIKKFKKGFAAACSRAGIENLRPYDLRGTFATRLAERYVPMDPIISSLLGHTRSSEGFGNASRITPGYTQAT